MTFTGIVSPAACTVDVSKITLKILELNRVINGFRLGIVHSGKRNKNISLEGRLYLALESVEATLAQYSELT
jgi:hypothetical protein